MRALVVEDDAETRRTLTELLESDGCTVDTAADGARAVAFLTHKDYHVVLLDLGLPRVDGNDIMEHIACTRPHTLARTIVVTGSDPARVRQRFPEVGGALGKPVAPDALLSAVREVSGRN